MSTGLFPERTETDRLVLERLSFDRLDPMALYDLACTDGWERATADHMPWYGFDTPKEVHEYVENAETAWGEADKAVYTVRPKDAEPRAGDLAGLTTLNPEWDRDRAGAGVVLAAPFWGRGYGVERGREMVRLTFERLDLGAFVTTCAAGNDRSRGMIESYLVDAGGQCDGLLRHENPRPDGRMTDQYRFSLLREEWEREREQPNDGG
ncbi:MAG: GNAT family N-acetyltransferase [Haloarculaceae archaeon]